MLLAPGDPRPLPSRAVGSRPWWETAWHCPACSRAAAWPLPAQGTWEHLSTIPSHMSQQITVTGGGQPGGHPRRVKRSTGPSQQGRPREHRGPHTVSLHVHTVSRADTYRHRTQVRAAGAVGEAGGTHAARALQVLAEETLSSGRVRVAPLRTLTRGLVHGLGERSA